MLNMDMKERIRSKLDELGMNQVDLANRVGVSKATITFWLRGDHGLKADNLMKLASALGCSPTWLQTGKGPEGKAKDGSPSTADYVLIPHYDAKAACGDGYLNDHVEINGGLAFRRDWIKSLGRKSEDLYVIYAQGESMEPYIFEGDIVMVDTSSVEPGDRHVYALRRSDDCIIIKRLVRQSSGGWVIRSDNPDKTAYPDEPVTEAVLHEIPILGRVIWRGGGVG